MIIEIYLVLFEFHHGGERAHMHDMSSRTLLELEHDGGKTSRAGCTELLRRLLVPVLSSSSFMLRVMINDC
jgi:hypothetical protein